MEVVDYFVVGIVVLSALVSFARGFIREALSLGGLVIACAVALFGAKYAAPHLVDQLANPQLRFWAAAAGLFVATLFTAAIVNYLLSKFLLNIGINGTDRFLGILLGAARGVVIVALFIIVANVLALPIKQWWPNSQFLGHFDDLATMISDGANEAYETWKEEQARTPSRPPTEPVTRLAQPITDTPAEPLDASPSGGSVESQNTDALSAQTP